MANLEAYGTLQICTLGLTDTPKALAEILDELNHCHQGVGVISERCRVRHSFIS
jgi:hypothetical protein